MASRLIWLGRATSRLLALPSTYGEGSVGGGALRRPAPSGMQFQRHNSRGRSLCFQFGDQFSDQFADELADVSRVDL